MINNIHVDIEAFFQIVFLIVVYYQVSNIRPRFFSIAILFLVTVLGNVIFKNAFFIFVLLAFYWIGLKNDLTKKDP